MRLQGEFFARTFLPIEAVVVLATCEEGDEFLKQAFIDTHPDIPVFL